MHTRQRNEKERTEKAKKLNLQRNKYGILRLLPESG
jgi:hypothetical protein